MAAPAEAGESSPQFVPMHAPQHAEAAS
jgi:hypothetical protein